MSDICEILIITDVSDVSKYVQHTLIFAEFQQNL